jgi:hypothetical protein
MRDQLTAQRVLAVRDAQKAATQPADEQEGWGVRPDRSVQERQVRMENRELLQRLWREGAKPRVHSDGNIYVATINGIVPHGAWDVSKRVADARVASAAN